MNINLVRIQVLTIFQFNHKDIFSKPDCCIPALPYNRSVMQKYAFLQMNCRRQKIIKFYDPINKFE